MPPSAPRHRLAALAAVLGLLLPVLPDVAAAQEPVVDGSDGVAPPDSLLDPDVVDVDAYLVRPLLAVRGVSLRSLGYDGVPLDADVVDLATAPLPEEPWARVADITGRLEALPPQLEGVQQAHELLEGTLERLDSHVGAQRSTLALSELRVADTSARVVGARARVRELTDELDVHRRRMAEVAVAAYVRPPDADALSSVLGGAAATNDELTAEVLFSAKTDHDGLVRGDLEVARAVAAERLADAREDAAQADARAAEVRAALADVEVRRDAHREALAVVAGARATLEEALPALREDMDRTIEETWGALEALAAGQSVSGDAIVSVDGIRVHAAIAPRLQALLAAARADGVPLGGWGYRSTEQQIALRQKHCGPTPEDIYLKPSSQCSPPTARPGSSMHERGLAVDFHLAGRSISTRQSPGYQWLAANAATYGFHNLPSEPWHWSVNGQ